MFSLTRKTDYALVALAALAAAEPDSISTRDLAARVHVPLALLRNILKSLGRAELVTSTHGPRGGYRLARPPVQITVAQVVQAIEGPIRFTRCCPDAQPDEAGQHQCRLEHSCLIRGAIRRIHGHVVDYLAHVTLADMAQPAPTDTSAVIGLDLTALRPAVATPRPTQTALAT